MDPCELSGLLEGNRFVFISEAGGEVLCQVNLLGLLRFGDINFEGDEVECF
jgi:hypothetical protein